MTERSGGPRGQGAASIASLAEAMAHPVRAKLLVAVADKGEEGASITQLAERTGEAKRRVRYHLDAMLESGLVAIASERKAAGVIERLFRAAQLPWITDVELEELDEDQMRQISVEFFKAVFGDVSTAIRAKSLAERPGSLVRLPIEVDERGWRELVAVHRETLKKLQAIGDGASERLTTSAESPIVAMNALLLFMVPPWPAP